MSQFRQYVDGFYDLTPNPLILQLFRYAFFNETSNVKLKKARSKGIQKYTITLKDDTEYIVQWSNDGSYPYTTLSGPSGHRINLVEDDVWNNLNMFWFDGQTYEMVPPVARHLVKIIIELIRAKNASIYLQKTKKLKTH
jgi:hypothetical protein